jgi:cell wall-associated NlpC family hydrolase
LEGFPDMPIPIWAGRYIGLPFRDHGRERSGLDCWGLVRLVSAEQFGRALPSLVTSYRRTSSVEDVSAVIAREASRWHAIKQGEEKQGDVIVLRLRGAPMHVGLVLGGGYMLHVERGIDSAIERYDGPRWAERIHGFFRHRPPYEDDEGHDGRGYVW